MPSNYRKKVLSGLTLFIFLFNFFLIPTPEHTLQAAAINWKPIDDYHEQFVKNSDPSEQQLFNTVYAAIRAADESAILAIMSDLFMTEEFIAALEASQLNPEDLVNLFKSALAIDVYNPQTRDAAYRQFSQQYSAKIKLLLGEQINANDLISYIIAIQEEWRKLAVIDLEKNVGLSWMNLSKEAFAQKISGFLKQAIGSVTNTPDHAKVKSLLDNLGWDTEKLNAGALNFYNEFDPHYDLRNLLGLFYIRSSINLSGEDTNYITHDNGSATLNTYLGSLPLDMVVNVGSRDILTVAAKPNIRFVLWDIKEHSAQTPSIGSAEYGRLRTMGTGSAEVTLYRYAGGTPAQAWLFKMKINVSPLTSLNITTSSNYSDRGTVNSPAGAVKGEIVNISAVANPGYHFKEWRVISGPVVLSSTKTPEATFTMPGGPVEIQAEFSLGNAYDIKLSSNNESWGTAKSSVAFALPGDTVTLTAMAKEDSQFKQWHVTSGGIVISSPDTPTVTFTMPTMDVEIQAEFKNLCSVTMTVNNTAWGYSRAMIPGIMSPEKIASGTEVSIYAYITDTQQQGINFVKWQVIKGDIVIADPYSQFTSFIMPFEDVEIQGIVSPALLNLAVYAKTVNDLEAGTVAITKGSAQNKYDDRVTVKASPNTDYSFSKWVDTDDAYAPAVSNEEVYSFNIKDHTALYAVFNDTRLIFDKQTGTITGWPSARGNVVIPDQIDGVTVKAIGHNAFRYNANIISISIPDTVTAIGFAAFAGCFRLSDINLPAALISIGYASFLGCSSLQSITIPAAVTSIDNIVFYDCSGLRSVIFTGKFPSSLFGGDIFPNNDDLAVYYTPEAKALDPSWGSKPIGGKMPQLLP